VIFKLTLYRFTVSSIADFGFGLGVFPSGINEYKIQMKSHLNKSLKKIKEKAIGTL